MTELRSDLHAATGLRPPGGEQRRPRGREVLGVAGDHGQPIMDGGGGNQAIDHRQTAPVLPGRRAQATPCGGHDSVNRQDPRGVGRSESSQPRAQGGPPPACGQKRDALLDRADNSVVGLRIKAAWLGRIRCRPSRRLSRRFSPRRCGSCPRSQRRSSRQAAWLGHAH